MCLNILSDRGAVTVCGTRIHFARSETPCSMAPTKCSQTFSCVRTSISNNRTRIHSYCPRSRHSMHAIRQQHGRVVNRYRANRFASIVAPSVTIYTLRHTHNSIVGEVEEISAALSNCYLTTVIIISWLKRCEAPSRRLLLVLSFVWFARIWLYFYLIEKLFRNSGNRVAGDWLRLKILNCLSVIFTHVSDWWMWYAIVFDF